MLIWYFWWYKNTNEYKIKISFKGRRIWLVWLYILNDWQRTGCRQPPSNIYLSETLRDEINFCICRFQVERKKIIIENVLFLISSLKFPCDCELSKDELFHFPGYRSNRSENWRKIVNVSFEQCNFFLETFLNESKKLVKELVWFNESLLNKNIRNLQLHKKAFRQNIIIIQPYNSRLYDIFI